MVHAHLTAIRWRLIARGLGITRLHDDAARRTERAFASGVVWCATARTQWINVFPSTRSDQFQQDRSFELLVIGTGLRRTALRATAAHVFPTLRPLLAPLDDAAAGNTEFCLSLGHEATAPRSPETRAPRLRPRLRSAMRLPHDRRDTSHRRRTGCRTRSRAQACRPAW